jgi:CheY-like chemotaxis protein
MDDYRYEQCLSNLLSNAIKFSEGGSIQVLLAMAGEGPARKMVLAVRDTGIGMAQSALTDIFEPFKQADNTISGRFGGTGLGLSIVKDLVELMGGRIDVNSQVGKGTLFAISIPEARLSVAPGPSEATPPRQQPTAAPVAQAPAAPAPKEPKPVQADTVKPEPVQNTPAPAQPSAKPDNPFEGLSVLIVDDNATNHIVASSLLSRVVGDIDTALNGREALDKLAAKPYDLVLMDIHMPVMDGIETTIAIRTQPSSFQSVPIIALTADPQYQQARICRNIGMNSSLGKPIKLASLLEAFDDVLFGESRVIATAA